MATFEHPEGLARFTLPDKIKVRQELAYLDALAAGPSRLEFMWKLAASVAQDWRSDAIPDPRAPGLLEKEDSQIARIIVWVCGEMAEHFGKVRAGEIPKATSNGSSPS